MTGIGASVPKEQKRTSARYVYMDFLRILACFLVIVNHTNSYVFKAATPGDPVWFLSILWYYGSKIAVPLFVMVSGACLLPRQDSYRRIYQRFLRMLLALVLFSYGYYLFGLWKTYWTWEKALDIPGFLRTVWGERITDSFWYLSFYLGLMVMLPLLQRMARGMEKRDYHYLLGVSFGVHALWPLVVHYVPELALPEYFELPLMNVFLGLFFAGHYVHAYGAKKKERMWMAAGAAALSLALCAGLTWVEAGRVLPGEKYWFMDDRGAPAFPVIVCTVAVMYLAKAAFSLGDAEKGSLSPAMGKRLAELGACAFPIYLLQDLFVAETRYRVFVPLCEMMNPFLAALVWEVGIFLVLLPIALVLKRIPGLRRIV